MHLDIDLGTVTDLSELTTAFAAAEVPVTVLAKPSDHIEAYFEGTEGLVAGVNDAYYTGKIVFQEIGDSAKRFAAHDTTDNTTTALAVIGDLESGALKSTLGLLASAMRYQQIGLTSVIQM